MRRAVSAGWGAFGLIIAALMLLAGAARAEVACEWKSYEPQVESVAGTLKQRTYEDPREAGPRTRTVMVLEPVTPVCMKPDASGDFNVEERDVMRIQVVYGTGLQKALRGLLNKRVVVTGTLFHAHTALHLEKILINASSVEPAPPR